MNLLEHFNHLYKNQTSKSFEISLLNFYKNDVVKRLPSKNITVLDLGSGPLSLFENMQDDYLKVMAIDFSPEAIKKSHNHGKIEYFHSDITDEKLDFKINFSLIFDSHCIHCLKNTNDRKKAFENIYKFLSQDGIFASEMMISKSSLPATHLKYAPTAIELEEELLSHGFKINFFVVCRDIYLESEGISFDMVRVILSK